MRVLSITLLLALRFLCYISMLIISWFGASVSIVNYVVVLLNFIVIASFIFEIPLNLNWSKSLYSKLFKSMLFFISISIISFSIIYYKVGLLHNGNIVYSYYNSLYFSFSMWTALGYGEILPSESLRMITSLEALIGLTMFPIISTFIWMYCQERLKKDPIEEKTVNVSMRFDPLNGVMIANEDEKILNERVSQFNLNACSRCDGNNLQILKYYDVINKLVPLSKFVVKCECGQMSIIKYNTYCAVQNWNKLNKHKNRKV